MQMKYVVACVLTVLSVNAFATIPCENQVREAVEKQKPLEDCDSKPTFEFTGGKVNEAVKSGIATLTCYEHLSSIVRRPKNFYFSFAFDIFGCTDVKVEPITQGGTEPQQPTL